MPLFGLHINKCWFDMASRVTAFVWGLVRHSR
jgi:hypothetical protein